MNKTIPQILIIFILGFAIIGCNTSDKNTSELTKKLTVPLTENKIIPTGFIENLTCKEDNRCYSFDGYIVIREDEWSKKVKFVTGIIQCDNTYKKCRVIEIKQRRPHSSPDTYFPFPY